MGLSDECAASCYDVMLSQYPYAKIKCRRSCRSTQCNVAHAASTASSVANHFLGKPGSPAPYSHDHMAQSLTLHAFAEVVAARLSHMQV